MSTSNDKQQQPWRINMVPMGSMEVYQSTQRPQNQAWVEHLLSNFDPSLVGLLVVCHRNGRYYIVDGQHRYYAYRAYVGDGWERKHIQCRVYDDLTDREMAELFLQLNDTRSVTAYDRFEKSVVAKRDDESEVNKIVKESGLAVKPGKADQSVGCVGTLMRVYNQLGPDALRRSLRITYEALGNPGLSAAAIEGIALVCHRYDKQVSDQRIIDKLSVLKGGAGALDYRASRFQAALKKSRPQCYASAVVDVLNSGVGHGSKKLPNWFETT